jgi:hypothetical protein
MTVIAEENQTIFDLAVQHYGTVEAVEEILELNPGLENDPKHSGGNTNDFWLCLPVKAGSEIAIDEKSPLMDKNAVKHLKNEHITTWQEL